MLIYLKLKLIIIIKLLKVNNILIELWPKFNLFLAVDSKI